MSVVPMSKLQQAMVTYRQLARSIEQMEGKKDKLHDDIVKLMERAKLTEYQARGLRAIRGLRLMRKYRVTAELAKLLEAANIEAFIASKPVDEAVSRGVVSQSATARFVVSREVPFLDVREIPKEAKPA